MPDEFKIGDRVTVNRAKVPKHYDPGPGTVSNVTRTRVVVMWDAEQWKQPVNYKPETLVKI